jgi:hypothetical protein
VIYRKLSVCSVTLCNHRGGTAFELVAEEYAEVNYGYKRHKKGKFVNKKL